MLVVFDVIGTLFSLDAVRDRMRDEQLPIDLLDFWLARLLHASFAHTLADRYRPYRELMRPTLRQALAVRGLPDDGVERVLDGFDALQPWDDTVDCLDALLAAGHEIVALTNGGEAQTLALMERGGIRDRFAAVHSADEVRQVKPNEAPYRMVLDRFGRAPAGACMVAVHGWDILGASAVGMRTVWVSRVEEQWPFHGTPPDGAMTGLAGVADWIPT